MSSKSPYPTIEPKQLWFWLILLFILPYCSVIAQSKVNRYTISGYIADAQSGERLIGATIYEANSKQGTVSNTYGFYSLTLDEDSVDLQYSYVGYGSKKEKFQLEANRVLNIQLENFALLDEVQIIAERAERIEQNSRMSTIDVPIEQIKHVPAMLGEVDVLKVLQLLPGVSSGGEGQAGIYVRGGSADQNLILLDGVPVYNANHLFGFFSVFNSDAIKDVSLVKGGFPARYGGRLSSVIDISLKDGHEKEWHGAGSIGLVASRLTLEGPLQKGKSSILVSGRRTYIDVLAQPFYKKQLQSKGKEGSLGYYFYDLNAKINYHLSDRDRLYISFYGGKDKFYQTTREVQVEKEDEATNGLYWGNVTTALRWNHEWNNKLFFNALLTYSHYRFSTGLGYEEKFKQPNSVQRSYYNLDYYSGINDVTFKIDFDYVPHPDHYLKFGVSSSRHSFFPGDFKTQFKNQTDSLANKFDYTQPTVNAYELDAYIENDWKVSDRLRLNFGLHNAAFLVQGKTYGSLQPRLNARYLVTPNWALKGAFSYMQQFIHLLTNETIGLPTDLWLPATARIKPQSSWQGALGIARTLGQKWEFSVEAYYKKMNNIIAYREGSSLFDFTNWEDRIAQGEGEAYGSEFFLQKKTGRFTGWIGYTLSWTWRRLDEVNFGRKYPFRYDRRHDIELTGTYKLSDRIRLSATWVYGTGNAVTFGTSKYAYIFPENSTKERYWQGFSTQVHTPERNNFRFPPYHRFDIGIDFTKEKKHHTRIWSIGAYNAYNRANAFYLFLDDVSIRNEQGIFVEKTSLKRVAIFPIVPYFSYNFKF